MVKINLKDYYPHYECDVFVEISDELAAQLWQWVREESAYQRKRRRYYACNVLDTSTSTGRDIRHPASSPYEIYEHNLSREQLLAALSVLPEKQTRRLIAYYVMGMSQAAIAREERVSRNAVHISIQHGLSALEKNLKKFSKGV